jgi:5-methylcytosine-specific restriction protein A
MARSRTQAWLRDELILALDLYIKKGASPPASSLEALSGLLRRIPIESELADEPSFRSSGAVGLKLGNFMALYTPGHGMPHGGSGDAEVWREFAGDETRLSQTAAAISAGIAAGYPSPRDDVDDDPNDTEAVEGRVLSGEHRWRERNAKLVKRKKAEALKRDGRLTCEACGFDFAATYGERGTGYIECHHTVPLHQLKPGTRTKLEDLALLCANCHRMVHARKGWLTMPQLHETVARFRRQP